MLERFGGFLCVNERRSLASEGCAAPPAAAGGTDCAQARSTVSKTSVQNLRDDADCAGIAQPRMRQDLDRVRIR